MRQLVPIALSQGTLILIGLVSAKLISRWVPKDILGEYTLFLSLTVLGSLLTHSGLANHAARYWMRERQQSGKYARFLWLQSWRLGSWLGSILLAICLVMAFLKGSLWLAFLPLLVISNMAVALGGAAANIYIAQEKYWRAFLLNTFANLRMVVPVLAVVWGGAAVLVMASGMALHSLGLLVLIVLAFRFAWFFPSPTPPDQASWLKELKEYGRPFILIGLGGWFLLYIDRWIVAYLYGTDTAGTFGYAWSLAGSIPSLAGNSLLQLVFPKVFRKADLARSESDWKRLFRWCDLATAAFILLSLSGLFVLTLIGPWLTTWLISPEYEPAISMLISAGAVTAASQVNQFQFLLLQAQHNSAGVVRVLLILATIKTAGSLLAALISWQAFLIWLVVSLIINAVLGRFLVHRNLRPMPPSQEPQYADSKGISA